jgi:hypothetical protein
MHSYCSSISLISWLHGSDASPVSVFSILLLLSVCLPYLSTFVFPVFVLLEMKASVPKYFLRAVVLLNKREKSRSQYLIKFSDVVSHKKKFCRCGNCEASYREVMIESLISSTTTCTWRDQVDILVSQTSIRPRWKQIEQIFNVFLFKIILPSPEIYFFSRLMVHELLYFRVIIVIALIYSYVHFF